MGPSDTTADAQARDLDAGEPHAELDRTPAALEAWPEPVENGVRGSEGGTGGSPSGYLREMRAHALLSRDEEREQGRIIQESRVAMIDALAPVPCASSVLAARFVQADRGERSLTDVFFAPYELDARRDDAAVQSPSSDPDSALRAHGTRTAWRDAGQALVAGVDVWRKERDETRRARAARVLDRAFRRMEPGMAALGACLDACRALEATAVDSPAVAATAAGAALERETGTSMAALGAACRAAGTAHATYLRARDRMVVANLRLAHHVAHQFTGNGLDLEDLVQESMLGLLRAVDRFDHRLGYRFSTYAYTWIRQTAARAIADASRTVRVAAYVHDNIVKLRKTSRQLEQRLGRSATSLELASASGLEHEQVARALEASRASLSFDATVPDTDDADLHARAADESPGADPVEAADASLSAKHVDRLLATLPARQAFVLRMRLGIGIATTHTLEEVGSLLGVTRERVRQIEADGLAKLRERTPGERWGR